MFQLPYFELQDQPNKVCLLKKFLCKLKQAANVWLSIINSEFMPINFTATIRVKAIYKKVLLAEDQRKQNIMYIYLYVDDILIASSQEKIVIQFKEQFRRKFQIKDLGIVKSFLGIKIEKQVKKGKLIYIWSQEICIDQLLYKFQMTNYKPAHTLLSNCKPGRKS